SRRRHTRFSRDWSSDVCSSDLYVYIEPGVALDCCGRELIVPERKLVRVLDLIAENEIDFSGEEAQDLFIALCYAETAEEPIPVRSEERRVGKERRSRWCQGD